MRFIIFCHLVNFLPFIFSVSQGRGINLQTSFPVIYASWHMSHAGKIGSLFYVSLLGGRLIAYSIMSDRQCNDYWNSQTLSQNKRHSYPWKPVFFIISFSGYKKVHKSIEQHRLSSDELSFNHTNGVCDYHYWSLQFFSLSISPLLHI